jgi:hypothetical protein
VKGKIVDGGKPTWHAQEAVPPRTGRTLSALALSVPALSVPALSALALSALALSALALSGLALSAPAATTGSSSSTSRFAISSLLMPGQSGGDGPHRPWVLGGFPAPDVFDCGENGPAGR